MENSDTPFPEARQPILSAGEFVDWHTKLGDEIDLEAKALQMELEEDPSLRNDESFKERIIAVRAKTELLNRVGDDFSSHSLGIAAELIIRKSQEEDK